MASEGSWTSLSSCGIQYRILAVLNAQGPLFIGWGAEWETAVICTVAVRTVNLGRPDGQQCDRIFWKFHWKSFLFKSHVRTVRHWRPDGRMSTASNFHIRLSRFRTKGDERPDGWTSTRNFHICYAHVWTMKGRRLDGWSRIGNFLNRWARVRTNADWRLDGCIWIAILALFMSASGREITSSGRCINLPLFWTWKESEADRSLMDVRTGCWDVWTDANWNRSFLIQWRVRTEKYVVRTDDACLSGVRTG
jgi:hypothetical protein